MRTILNAILPALLLAAGIGASPAAPPIYPGAIEGAVPVGIGIDNQTPPKSAKAYSTSDDFAKVKAWYKAHLPGAIEVVQPGMGKTEDAFLVGKPETGTAYLIRRFKGKTWIVIGPAS